MKKYFTFQSIGWLIVLFEIILCTVFALSVVLVNGADSWSSDHNSLVFLLTLTLTSLVLMKSGKRFLNKAVVAIAALPLLAIAYQAALLFSLPAQQVFHSHPVIASMFVF